MEWISFPSKEKIYLGYFLQLTLLSVFTAYNPTTADINTRRSCPITESLKLYSQEVSILMFTVPKNHSSSIINVYETFALSHPDTAIIVHFKYLPLKQIK